MYIQMNSTFTVWSESSCLQLLQHNHASFEYLLEPTNIPTVPCNFTCIQSRHEHVSLVCRNVICAALSKTKPYVIQSSEGIV